MAYLDRSWKSWRQSHQFVDNWYCEGRRPIDKVWLSRRGHETKKRASGLPEEAIFESDGSFGRLILRGVCTAGSPSVAKAVPAFGLPAQRASEFRLPALPRRFRHGPIGASPIDYWWVHSHSRGLRPEAAIACARSRPK